MSGIHDSGENLTISQNLVLVDSIEQDNGSISFNDIATNSTGKDSILLVQNMIAKHFCHSCIG